MKFKITTSEESESKEDGMKKSIKEVTDFEDADSSRIASELDILEGAGYEVTVTATAKPI